MTLPPLPGPFGFTAGNGRNALFSPSRQTAENYAIGACEPLYEWYTADQMRTYGAACAAAERERCAEMCEKKGHAMQSESEAFRGCDLWIQGGADASLECAAAIRSKS